RALVGGKLPGRVRSQLESSLGGSMATTWEVLGETHLAAGRRRLAAEAFSRLSQIPAAEARAAYWLARLALDERRPLLAYELVRRCLAEADPGAAATLQNRASKLLGDVYAQLNQPLAVVDDLRQIAEGRPEDATARLMLGVALADAGRVDEAQTVLEGVVRRAFAAARADPLLIELADEALPEPDYATIGRASDWLLTRYAGAGDTDAFVRLTVDLHRVFEGFGEFEPALAEAFGDNPGFAADLFEAIDAPTGESSAGLPAAAVGELAIAAGRYQRAADAYREAIASTPEDDTTRIGHALAWWQGLMLAGQYAAAADALQWTIDNRVWPDDASDPYYQLAASLAFADKPAEAVDAAQEAVRREPDDPATLERLGWTLTEAGRYDEAIASHRRLVELFDPDPSPATREVIRTAKLSLSYVLDDRGDTEAATEWGLQVLDEHPDDAGGLNDLAYLWTKQGKHRRRAAAMASRAVELEPDNAAYWDTVGWARFRVGETESALEAIERALALQAEQGADADGEILDHLGDIQSALGNQTAAVDAWRRAAEAFDAVDDAESEAAVRAKLAPAAGPPAVDPPGEPPR
ncbi:MAG: tetratricopeptide repeat protein, partial [Planctomycetota bacterium]